MKPRNIAVLMILPCLALVACGDGDRAERLKAAGPNPSLDALMRVADADAGGRTFGQCLACHTIGKGSSTGPAPICTPSWASR